MTCLLIKHKDFITRLAKLKGSRQNLLKLIRKSKNEEIKAISELSNNLLRRNVYCHKNRKRELKHHIKNLRKVGDKNISLANKRKILLKGEGIFLSALLPVAISAIAGLFRK